MTAPACGKCGEPMGSENSVLAWGVEFHLRCFRGQQPAIGATAPPPPEETPWESEKRYAREHSGGTGEAITPPAPAADVQPDFCCDLCDHECACHTKGRRAAKRQTIHLWGDQFFYCDEGWGKTCHDEARGDCLDLEDAKWLIELIRRVRP